MNTIGIEQFLKIDNHFNNTYVKIYDTHITVMNSIYISNSSLFIHDIHMSSVNINKVLDVNGVCNIHNGTIDNIVNVKDSIFTTDYYKLVSGSFIGTNIYHCQDEYHTIYVNGYITQSGIIS